jgi:hypothetical protein
MSERPDRRKDFAGRPTVRLACLAALTGLSAATPLIVSESAAHQGTYTPLVILYLVLAAAWVAATLLRRDHVLRFDLISLAVVALVAWQGISVIVMGPHGAPRPAINVFWLWVAFGTAFLLVRELVRSPLECRALVAVMIAVAVGVSSYAYYEFFVEMPQERLQYRADPEGTLLEQGLYFPPGSVERELFEQRLFSSEPTATFALTNSLAGFLVPWLVLSVGIVACCLRYRFATPLAYGGAIMAAGWIGGCLLLTKSRTAYLAAGLGVVLVSLLYGAPKWKWGRRILMAAAGLMAVGLVAVMLLSVADTQMLSEAPKSLLYRFQYWEGAARMIADHPWFGCGPGNFQTCYTTYMLPEASEQVADPHNFLFEIWATAGTPAAMFLIAALALFARRVFRPDDGATGNEPPPPAEAKGGAGRGDVPAQRATRLIYVGGLCGALAALPVRLMVHLPVDLYVWIFGVPMAAIAVFLLHPWVVHGRLDARAVAIAVVALLVNLLAAGGIAFPGVAGSLWVLMGVALVVVAERANEPAQTIPVARDRKGPRGGREVQTGAVERDAQPVGGGQTRFAFPHLLDRVFALDRGAAIGVLLFLLTLFAICYATGYAPVLHGRTSLDNGVNLVYQSREPGNRREGRTMMLAALSCFEKAAAADPFAAEPRLNAARLYHLQRLQAADAAGFEAATDRFDAASREAVRLNPRSHTMATEIGYMEFEAYASTENPEHLRRARKQLERAAQVYPNHSYARARLAWMYHLEGNPTAAVREAEEALRLDALTPHRERKLSQRGIFDDLAAPEQLERVSERLPPGRTAEQLMSDVRNVQGEAAR